MPASRPYPHPGTPGLFSKPRDFNSRGIPRNFKRVGYQKVNDKAQFINRVVVYAPDYTDTYRRIAELREIRKDTTKR